MHIFHIERIVISHIPKWDKEVLIFKALWPVMSPLSFTPPANTDPVKELGKLKSIYPSMNYHITSGDTEQVTEKLDKGLLDFAVICEPPDERKYDYSAFPEADIWGAVMPSGHPLARKLLLQ